MIFWTNLDIGQAKLGLIHTTIFDDAMTKTPDE